MSKYAKWIITQPMAEEHGYEVAVVLSPRMPA